MIWQEEWPLWHRMWFNVGAKSVITSHMDIPEIRNKADIPKIKDAVKEILMD